MAASTIGTDHPADEPRPNAGRGTMVLSNAGATRVVRTLGAMVVLLLFGIVPILGIGGFAAWNTALLLGTCALFMLICLLRDDALGVFVNATLIFLILYPFFIQTLIRVSFIGANAGDMETDCLLLMFVFVVGLNFVYLLPDRARHAIRQAAAARGGAPSAPTVDAIKVVLVPVLCFCVMLAVFGSGEIFLSRQRYLFGEAEELGNVQKFLRDILKLLPYWIIFFYIVRSRGRVKPPLLIAIFIALIISNPINTQRFNSLFGISLIFFAFLVSGRGQMLWRNAYLLCAIALILLPVTSSMRGGDIVLTVEEVMRGFVTLEFSAVALLNDMLRLGFQSDTGPVRVISAVMILIPRAIWPEKNEGTGQEIAEQLNYVFSNVGVPPVADAWLDAGLAGVVVLGIAVGFAYRWARVALSGGMPAMTLGFAARISLIGLTPLLMRGDLSVFFIAFYSALAAFVLARFLARLTTARVGMQSPRGRSG